MKLDHHPHVFPKRQIRELFSITDRMIDYWCKEVFTREKQSERMKFNFRDLCMVACIVHFRENVKLSIQKIRTTVMPAVEEGVNRARAIGKSIPELRVTWWNKQLLVYSGEIYYPLDEWQKNTVDFKELWDKVRGIKILSQED